MDVHTSPSYQRSHTDRQRMLQARGECLNCVHEAQQVMFCTECRPQGHMSCCRTSFHAWMKLEIRASNPGSAYCLLDIPWTGETMKWCNKNRRFITHYTQRKIQAPLPPSLKIYDYEIGVTCRTHGRDEKWIQNFSRKSWNDESAYSN